MASITALFLLATFALIDARPSILLNDKLFLSTPYVIELDAPDFDKYVYCQGEIIGCQAHLVLFYDSNSSLSREFVPLVKELGESTRNWGHLVRIVAVNCADDMNKGLCERNKFREMATLMYYSRNAFSGEGRIVPTHTDTSALLDGLIEQMSMDMEWWGFPDWPNFGIVPKNTDYGELWHAQDEEGALYILLLFVEKKIDFSTMNLLINTKKQKPDLDVRVLQKGSLVQQLLGIRKYPTYMMIRKTEKPELGVELNEDLPGLGVYKNLSDEYAKMLEGTGLEFYDKYSKSLRRIEPDDDDDIPITAIIRLYVNDKHGEKSALTIRDNSYDAIEFKLKENLDLPAPPVQSMALGNDKNAATGQGSLVNWLLLPATILSFFRG